MILNQHRYVMETAWWSKLIDETKEEEEQKEKADKMRRRSY